ncbi:MAG: phospholipase D-like domain-containing protein [Oscillospiraceae bacterium]|nr:phospholipase D-like domain-containing protein [Oscillospiraceae bacterium]
MKATDGYTDQESMGMQLLKKGRRGLGKVLFSRAGLVALLLLLQIAILIGVQVRFKAFLPHYYLIVSVFCVVMVLYLFNGKFDPSAKLTWLVVIMLMPAFGALLLLYTQSDVGHRLMKGRFAQIMADTKDDIPQDAGTLEKFRRDAPSAAGLACYLGRTGCHPVYDKTAVTYFPLGEDKFKELLIQLDRAEKFIFLEYFIIDEGLMWGRVLELLAKKAAQGVEVRVMYDGSCEFSTLPHDYPRRLAELGIKCKMFGPIAPFVSTHYNYRDHRKILVIDGRVAFNGGVNLADEYINRFKKHGHWKDTAVMLRGEAARSFTLMFLQMWNVDEREQEDFEKYITAEAEPAADAAGYVLPYGDCPLDDERVGEWTYMDILNRAERYVHIMTPYLILDGEMETAMKFAAERGVDVSLILPGIPDKKLIYALAKTHYSSLLRSGVKLYEYTPGFVHAKVFVSDDREAVVGSINLDYRSLYHHFECATYLNRVSCIGEIAADFEKTRALCRTVTPETVKAEKLSVRIAGYLMKVVAPLL